MKLKKIDRSLVLDPGGRNWACVFIENLNPIYMFYLPVDFKITDKKQYNRMMKFVLFLLKKCDNIIIERYIVRRVTKHMSPEKINILIGLFLTFCHIAKIKILATTPSVWKQKYKRQTKFDYKLFIKLSQKYGYKSKDKHFVDCLLMYLAITEQISLVNVHNLFKNGIKVYNKVRKNEH